jgi:mRNA interferase ChpB
MRRYRVPQRGDVYWVDPNPVVGREMKDRHPFVVITPKEINAFGIAMAVPVTSGGAFARDVGLVVPIDGVAVKGVVVCNQVRAFDMEARLRNCSARFVETLDPDTTEEIVDHVLSIIDPAEK